MLSPDYLSPQQSEEHPWDDHTFHKAPSSPCLSLKAIEELGSLAPELLGLLARHPAVNTALHHELVSVLTLLHAGARTQAWFSNTWVHVRPLQSCPTLCDPMDCSPPGSSVHRDSPGKNTGLGHHALLQGILCIQGWACYFTINQSEDCVWVDHTSWNCTSLCSHYAFQNSSVDAIRKFRHFWELDGLSSLSGALQ